MYKEEKLGRTVTKSGTEVKVGLTGATKRVLTELKNDLRALKQNKLDRVKWVFYRSKVTGEGGPTPKLKAAIDAVNRILVKLGKSPIKVDSQQRAF